MLGIQGINHLIINVSVRNMTSQRLRGLDIDWEEKLEVVNAFRINERRECRCVGAHIHDGGAMPSEGIA